MALWTQTKDEAINAEKRWIAETSDLREKYLLLVVMRDNAGEKKVEGNLRVFASILVNTYYSTGYVPHQDGLVEAGIESVFMLARNGMSRSGLRGKYWVCRATYGRDCRNVTNKERIQNTSWGSLCGEKKDVSKFIPFGCLAWIHLNKKRHKKGKTVPRAVVLWRW